ncbi:MAG: restriction endonuclease subunit S [Desulfobacteraceae bacterium]|nr:restriction endonuclease subunit S [Desulfobacteraceae bacterium]
MKLKDIVNIKAGYPFRGRIRGNSEGDTWVIQMKDVEIYQEVSWATLVKTKLIGRRAPDFLKPGDILFVARGRNNFALCLKGVPDRVVCSPHFFQMELKKDVDIIPEFLSWQINQAPAQLYFERSSEGSGTQNIRRGVLEDLSITIPTIDKQKLIVKLESAFCREQALMQHLMDNRTKMMEAMALDLLCSSNRETGK